MTGNLRRKDRDYNSDNFVVGDLHFQKDDLDSSNATRTITGRVRLRLGAQSVPIYFPTLPWRLC